MNKMLLSFIHQNRVALSIFTISFVIRLININWPFFSPEEARVIERGFLLAKTGKDELGRFLPLIFNSFSDYQLPFLSYFITLLEFIWGKSELIIRLGFIFLGSLTPVLTYLISERFLGDKKLRLFSALVVSFSPLAIFVSKVPNTSIIFVNIILLIFYLILAKKNRKEIQFLLCFIGLCLSKNAWIILPIFMPLTLILFTKNSIRSMISYSAVVATLTISIAVLFIMIPQSIRSLSENQFTILSNITIGNGINVLRGQGLEKQVPLGISRLIFNKLDVVPIGLLQASSYLRPNLFFGIYNIDSNIQNFVAGALSKIIIIPFLGGLYFLASKGTLEQRKLLLFPLIFIIPGVFKYPEYSTELVVIIIPIFSIISAMGLDKLRSFLFNPIVGLMIIELFFNSLYAHTGFIKKDINRPVGLASFFKSVSNSPTDVLISDNFYQDMIPYLGLYSKTPMFFTDQEIDFPYKFHESKFGKVTIIGSDTRLRQCLGESPKTVFLTKGDLKKIPKEIDFTLETAVLEKFLNKEIYKVNTPLCIKDE